MPKLKVHRGAKKRVQISGSGKLIRRRAYRNHFLSKKRGSRKRLYGHSQEFDITSIKSIRRKLGV